MSTEEPKTPNKTRPRLGRRSVTADSTLQSPPKKTVSGHSGIDSPKKQKQHHHLPFFHASNSDHTHRPHIPLYKGKKGDDPEGSKTNLRQHLPNINPVDGLATIVSNASGEKHRNGSRSPTRRGGQERERPIRPEQVEREREKARLREKYGCIERPGEHC